MPTPETDGAVPIPEKRLMAAILDDAFDIVAHPHGRSRRRLVRETHAWFASDDRAWPFSFRNVCAALGLDPAAVRATVARHRSARRVHRLAA